MIFLYRQDAFLLCLGIRDNLIHRFEVLVQDTFNRAFGYPFEPLWTINDLECRLNIMLETLQSTDPKLNKLDTIFQKLLNLPKENLTTSLILDKTRQNVLNNVTTAIHLAKMELVNDDRKQQYCWSDGHCDWTEILHDKQVEYRNDDVLMYTQYSGRTMTQYLINVTCTARFSKSLDLIYIALNSNLYGQMIEIPIGRYGIKEKFEENIKQEFEGALFALLSIIYKQQN